jgi:hypothetical protein
MMPPFQGWQAPTGRNSLAQGKTLCENRRNKLVAFPYGEGKCPICPHDIYIFLQLAINYLSKFGSSN